jgi:hypothetical protein
MGIHTRLQVKLSVRSLSERRKMVHEMRECHETQRKGLFAVFLVGWVNVMHPRSFEVPC